MQNFRIWPDTDQILAKSHPWWRHRVKWLSLSGSTCKMTQKHVLQVMYVTFIFNYLDILNPPWAEGDKKCPTCLGSWITQAAFFYITSRESIWHILWKFEDDRSENLSVASIFVTSLRADFGQRALLKTFKNRILGPIANIKRQNTIFKIT